MPGRPDASFPWPCQEPRPITSHIRAVRSGADPSIGAKATGSRRPERQRRPPSARPSFTASFSSKVTNIGREVLTFELLRQGFYRSRGHRWRVAACSWLATAVDADLAVLDWDLPRTSSGLEAVGRIARADGASSCPSCSWPARSSPATRTTDAFSPHGKSWMPTNAWRSTEAPSTSSRKSRTCRSSSGG